MRQPATLAVLVLVAALTGCRTAPRHDKVRTTPIEISGPVNVSGPVTVTGPVSVSGVTSGASSATTRAPDSTVVRGAPATTTATTQDGDGTHLELKTEGLTVQRNTVSNGAARIRKYVVTETQTIPTTVRREEISIERVPASGVPTTPFGEAEAVIEVPLTTETVVPVITPRVIERVRIHKTVSTDQKDVTATLRTEKLDVIKSN